ncbi:hypothetical transcript [Echinococcus multilocularis]|uniref:Hypothetical transcript n=1 Tax=Echinococcus multilocularis TaxID=6211 RepID=A0A068Y4W4_ECHMU|nr:hypothetical transcript [Echinococcus multilocularis]
MYFNWCLVSVVSTFTLALLPPNKASPVETPPLEDEICQITDTHTAICYVQCFEDITSLLPPGTNQSLIRHLIVYQTNTHCYSEVGLEVFNEFTSLQQLLYTGTVCPFPTLPNLSNITHLSFTLTAAASTSTEEFIWNNSTRTEIPQLEKLVVTENCCGLFQGTIVAPHLQHLSFRCSKMSSYISGVNETRNKLILITPELKYLDYQESASGFPIASASNLPYLQTLLVTFNTEFSENRVITSDSLNLSSVRELTFSQGEYGHIFGYEPYQCVELGETNLTHITLVQPPRGSTTCPSVWKCISCTPSNQNNSEGVQLVNIFTHSSTSANFSSLLPNVTLNTTDLKFNHAPLLQVDGEALRRFSHLRSLHVGEVRSILQYNGVVTLLGNPFKALQRPQTFQFLHLVLLKCDCEEYDTFAWLRAQNPTFEGEIQCITVPLTNSTEEEIAVNKSISITNFLQKLAKQCVTTPVTEVVNTSTTDQFALRTTTTTTTTTMTTTTKMTLTTTSGANSRLLPTTTTTTMTVYTTLLLSTLL